MPAQKIFFHGLRKLDMTKVFLTFLKDDLLMLLRSRLGMFWTLAFPVLMLVLQMTLFGGSASLGPVSMAIVDLDKTKDSQRYASYVLEGLKRQGAVTVNVVAAVADTKKPPDIVLTIPMHFGSNLAKGTTSRVEWSGRLVEGPAFGASQGIIRGLTDAFNFDVSPNPRSVSLALPAADTGKAGMSYPMFLTTGLSGMVLLSTSLMGFAGVLVAAREGGMFRLYQLFPVRTGVVLSAWWVSRLIVTLGSTVIMFVAALLLYKLNLQADISQLACAAGMLIIGTASFLSIGLVIASISNSVAVASILANLVYFPLLFSGNIIVPISGLPPAAREVLDKMPLNALVGSLRRILMHEATLEQEGYTILVLIVVSAVCLAVSFKNFKWVPTK